MSPRDIRSVTFYSTSEAGEPAYLRLLGPASQLGWQVIRGMQGDDIFPDLVNEGDLVLLQRDFPAHLAEYEQVLSLAHQQGKPVLLDLDDLLLEMPDQHPDKIERRYTKALLPMLQALLEVDAVTVSTAPLRDYLLPYNPNVLILPNFLNDTLWHFKTPATQPVQPERIVIGFMGGGSHKPDLATIEPVLHQLDQRYGGRLLFRFWGFTPSPDTLSLSQVQYEPNFLFTYPGFAEYFLQQSADIFLAPLADNLFNHCKSPIKYLEYAAAGVPAIFSRGEPYSGVVRDGVNGLLASSPAEWEQALIRLIEDASLRQALAMAAQEEVRAKWLLSGNAACWREAYGSVLAGFAPERPLPSNFHRLVRNLAHETGDAWGSELGRLERDINILTRVVDDWTHECEAIQAVQNSRTWWLAARLLALRDWLLPEGGRRKRLVQWLRSLFSGRHASPVDS